MERRTQHETFTGQLDGLNRWKQRQIETLGHLESWLKHKGLFTAEAQLAIKQASNTLSEDNITIAVVGEFSRGKTELINAIFFNDLESRLLPTDAGRTTMCPTEIFQDLEAEPYLRLLPIESRLADTSLGELKKAEDEWLHVPLALDKSKQLHKTLSRIKEKKTVSREVAERMGLLNSRTEPAVSDDGTEITVPAWRLAQLNYRHPLLAQGLRIIDTPGLNTISAEPELTYEILPSATAHLFVLGADTGVTQSDMDIWQQFVRSPGNTKQQSVLVVLNKSDTLWDELRTDSEIEDSIKRQCSDVAQILEIDVQQVFALSAQKALVARVKCNTNMERKSGINLLEDQLAHVLTQNRQKLIMDHATELVQSAVLNIETLVSSRIRRLQSQLHELSQLSTKSENAIAQMLQQAQADRVRYQTSINAYKTSREEFIKHGKLLLKSLSEKTLNKPSDIARKKMTNAWTTTRGLKDAIKVLFDEINDNMQVASEQSQEMRRLIRTIHRRFERQHNLQLGDPRMFSIISHQVELNLVHQESEIFRNSPRTTLTEQHLLTNRYFETIVHRVKKIFHAAHKDAKDWLDTALDPLTMQINEHRTLITDQMNDLKQAGQSRSTVKKRVGLLTEDITSQEKNLNALKAARQALSNRALPPKDNKAKSGLAKKSA